MTPDLDLGLGDNVNNKWRIAMSALTDAMAAAINTLKAANTGGGVTTQQVTDTVHSIVDPQITTLQGTIATITASEKDDAAKIVDINAALAEFTTAFAPAKPALPVVTGVSPATLAIAGGTGLTITGTGFTGATEVDLTGTTAGSTAIAGLNISVKNDTTITIDYPAIAAGVYDVTVKTPVGVSAVSTADQVTAA